MLTDIDKSYYVFVHNRFILQTFSVKYYTFEYEHLVGVTISEDMYVELTHLSKLISTCFKIIFRC